MQKDYSKVLLITDLDGTFLPHDKHVSEGDMKMIKKFRALGGKFTIATGRALHAVKPYLDIIKPDLAALMYNGAVAWDCNLNQAVFVTTLLHNALSYTKEIAENFPFAGCEVLCLDKVYVPMLNDVEQYHIDICKTDPIFCSFDEIKDDWIKVLFAVENQFQQDIADFCESKAYDDVCFVKSEKRFYEMLPKNVSKGSGLKRLIDVYKLQGYTIFAAGDYDNDIEMLKSADYGFAVANAQEAVKSAADYVLKSSNEDNPMTEILEFIYKEWDGGNHHE